jgi:integrase/recombinase XerD
MALKVNLKKYLPIDGHWQFVPVLKVNGKPRPDVVLIGGQSVKGTTGTFYLEWRQDGKRKQKPCGSAPREALDAWKQQSGILADPDAVAVIEDGNNKKTVIASACEVFLRQVKATKSEATHDSYSNDLEWFKTHIDKHYVSAVTRDDILRLMGIGRDEKLNQKTINKRLIVVLMALRNAGAEIKMKKGDWPKTTDGEVEIYTDHEIKSFFSACNPEEKLLFQVFLCTGFRAREVSTLTVDSVESSANRLRVKPRPEYKFIPKNYEERIVTVPASLMSTLKKHIKAIQTKLVFPTRPHPKRPEYGGDAPDAHHLELCKEIAFRAGLNCGLCKSKKGSCKITASCSHWFLHKWRHTYATNLLRSGVDIKTLQYLLGHKNLATTEKYLKSLPLEDLQVKVESSTLAALLT